jgi:hypothetical protein
MGAESQIGAELDAEDDEPESIDFGADALAT